MPDDIDDNSIFALWDRYVEAYTIDPRRWNR